MATDKAALEALYDATDGSNWTTSTNWKTSEPLSEWHGVTTDEDGRVTGLTLAGNELSGEIPAALRGLSSLQDLRLQSNMLTGEIPAALEDLSSLLQLWLQDNELSGEIPAALGDLSSLQDLRLQENELNGEIPVELGSLTHLQDLYLNGNELTGEIPAELGDLTNLQRLTLGNNQLMGEIPAALGGLSSLQFLQLQVNMLSGEIPVELGDLINLQRLILNDNQLTGSIPEKLGNLTNLLQLWLQDNELSGEIPAALGGLSSLQQLWLHRNQLTGEIPDGPRHLSNLTSLNVSGTNVCAPRDVAFQAWLATINFQGAVCTPPGGGGGGGGPRTSAPGAPRNLTAVGGDGEVVLTWDAPASDGGAAITDYEYRIEGRNPWISIGSTNTTHTVTGLVNGTEYTFQVRAVNRIGKSFAPNQVETTPEAPEVFTLDFAHFANGDGTTSDLVFVNVASHPIRPALYFYDTGGQPLAAESVVDITGDLEITEDGSLSIQTKMEPLGELTISTHGQGGAGERIGEGGRGRSHRRGLAL